ncbi:DNA repair protein RecN [Peptoniphilus mikwangii]|uniref:DNA repair protein RecN n=1 Tax=Peptoniphilus mikwangii TaxID=1354300 RepID=UPI00041CF120|nr:DNA repair protein RecN [Peptoniphilus mikwangii]
MLLELSIKNFAIIEDLRVEFEKGLNVITGETGSGKSIIIDALSMVLGARASKDVIKSGKEFAFIEAIFSNDGVLKTELEKYDIDNDDLIVISREIRIDRPSITKINGRTITGSVLIQITSKLIDIFAQHENISLMNNINQRKLIDSFGDDSHIELLNNLTILIEQLHKLKEDFKIKSSQNKNRDREIDLLKYQAEEIKNANLSEEDETIDDKYKIINNISEISRQAQSATAILNSSYDQANIEDLFDSVIGNLNFIIKYDKNMQDCYDELEDIRYRIKDISYTIEKYLSSLEYSEEELRFLENRIDTVNTLKKKYGNKISDIYSFLEEVENRLHFLENFDDEIKKLEDEISFVNNQALDIARKISENRKSVSKFLEHTVAEELKELNIKNARFKIDFREKEISKDGIDDIEFMIVTNAGEDFKSLADTASGGEMSRIMLGFKSIIAQKDNIQTLIFDEIDTGISGRTAQIVGNKIKKLAKDRQVIVISHLPQIVSLADTHYLIEKLERINETTSRIRKLNYNEREMELARLIGGFMISDATISAAREMLFNKEK